MPKALLIGDIHIADRPPSSRTDTYRDDILDKLKFVFCQARNADVDVVVCAGDIFHIKAPSRTSHGLVQDVIDVMQSVDVPVKIVPGNHDLMHDRLESIPTQPIGTLAKVPGIDLLMGQDSDFPWLFGLPYLTEWVDQLHLWMVRWQDSDSQLMVTHAPIFPAGEEKPYDYIDARDWAQWMSCPGFVYYGHIHDQHGVHHAGDVTFCNNGAISRGSLHEESLSRVPKVTIWDSTNGFSSIEVPCRPAREVFLLEERVEAMDQKERLAEFLTAVGETKLVGLSLEEVLAKARAMELKPGTLTVIEECIAHVS